MFKFRLAYKIWKWWNFKPINFFGEHIWLYVINFVNFKYWKIIPAFISLLLSSSLLSKTFYDSRKSVLSFQIKKNLLLESLIIQVQMQISHLIFLWGFIKSIFCLNLNNVYLMISVEWIYKPNSLRETHAYWNSVSSCRKWVIFTWAEIRSSYYHQNNRIGRGSIGRD